MREHFARILSAANCRLVASAPSIEDLVLPAIGVSQSILFVFDAGEEPHAAVRQIEKAKHSHPAGRIVVLAESFKLNEVVAAFLAGANAYFIKRPSEDVLIKSIELVMLGETFLPPEMLPVVHGGGGEAAKGKSGTRDSLKRASPGKAPRLSGRERAILRCLLAGDANKIIARKMQLSEGTVKVHVEAILHKIRVRNRTQAAVWAAQRMKSQGTLTTSDVGGICAFGVWQPTHPDSACDNATAGSRDVVGRRISAVRR
jgi:two-component system nitrate/nitrite response regulator NarL